MSVQPATSPQPQQVDSRGEERPAWAASAGEAGVSTDITRLREAFADPKRDAILIDTNNLRMDVVSPDTLTDDSVAAAYPKPGLLALDLDSPDLIKTAERFHKHEPGLRIIKCHSGGTTDEGVHKQHWIVCAGEITQQLRAALHQAGLPKQAIRYNQALRPPGSRHRKGGYGELIEPDVDTACAWMNSVASEPTQTTNTSITLTIPLEPIRERVDQLDQKTWNLIRNGKAAGDYQTGETARFGLAARLAYRGWTFDKYWGFLTNERFLIGDSLLGRNRDPQTRQPQSGQHLDIQPHGRAWLKAVNLWNTAVEQSAQSGVDLGSRADDDPLEHAFQVLAWLDRCTTYPLTDPRHRGTDRQVLHALGKAAIAHHNWTVLPGTRQIAVHAGVGQDAVAKSIKRLERHGMVTVIKPSEETATIAAHRIILNREWEEVSLSISTSEVDIDHPELFLPMRSAIWNQQALGNNARLVYAELTRGWFGATEMAESTGLTARTVRDLADTLLNLERSLSEGIVVGQSTGNGRVWQAATLSDPSAVEESLLNLNWGQAGTLDDKITRLQIKKDLGDATLKSRESIAQSRAGLIAG